MDIKNQNLNKIEVIDFPKAQKTRRTFKGSSATLFSKGRRTTAFFTEDSKLYITPKQQEMMNGGAEFDFGIKKWDALSARIVRDYKAHCPSEVGLAVKLEARYVKFKEEFDQASQSFIGQFSVAKLWNLSMVGAILFGMVSMTFIYRYLGQGAAAGVALDTLNAPVKNERVLPESELPGKIQTEEVTENVDEEFDFTRQPQVSDNEFSEKSKTEFEKAARTMVKGYPIEKMLPYILEKDQKVAAFLISIAKKESSFGERVPVLNGQDCYNYWGYRGQRKLMGSGGHTCFNSRKDAVDTVAKRLTVLVNEQKRDTPAKMVLWKCGNSCAATGGQAAANKWVSDVDGYFEKLMR